jgi:hypothetical protein
MVKTITRLMMIGTNIPALISFQSNLPPCALSLYSAVHIAIKVASADPKTHCGKIGANGVQIAIETIIAIMIIPPNTKCFHLLDDINHS